MQETMTHTTLQRIFSVLNCKLRMEKIMGTLSNLVQLKHGGTTPKPVWLQGLNYLMRVPFQWSFQKKSPDPPPIYSMLELLEPHIISIIYMYLLVV